MVSPLDSLEAIVIRRARRREELDGYAAVAQDYRERGDLETADKIEAALARANRGRSIN
jgi:hypothetical protein